MLNYSIVSKVKFPTLLLGFARHFANPKFTGGNVRTDVFSIIYLVTGIRLIVTSFIVIDRINRFCPLTITSNNGISLGLIYNLARFHGYRLMTLISIYWETNH